MYKENGILKISGVLPCFLFSIKKIKQVITSRKYNVIEYNEKPIIQIILNNNFFEFNKKFSLIFY